METDLLKTKRLTLTRQTEDEARAMVAALPPSDRAEISADWLAALNHSGAVDPWILGFTICEQLSGKAVGQCGFKGPPGPGRVVEIAYGIAPEYRGCGYATEAAQALVAFAFRTGQVEIVRAHTLPTHNASGRVLAKCGFKHLGEVIEPDDGLVWRWEINRLEPM